MGLRQINNLNNKQSKTSSHRKRSKLQHTSQAYTNSTNNSNHGNNETSDQVFQQSINQLRNEIHQLVYDPNTAAYGLIEPRNDIGFHCKPTKTQNNHPS